MPVDCWHHGPCLIRLGIAPVDLIELVNEPKAGLEKRCRKLGLDPEGRKKDLFARLVDRLASPQGEHGGATTELSVSGAELQGIVAETKEALLERCSALGIETTGLKRPQILARLVDSYTRSASAGAHAAAAQTRAARPGKHLFDRLSSYVVEMILTRAASWHAHGDLEGDTAQEREQEFQRYRSSVYPFRAVQRMGACARVCLAFRDALRPPLEAWLAQGRFRDVGPLPAVRMLERAAGSRVRMDMLCARIGCRELELLWLMAAVLDLSGLRAVMIRVGEAYCETLALQSRRIEVDAPGFSVSAMMAEQWGEVRQQLESVAANVRASLPPASLFYPQASAGSGAIFDDVFSGLASRCTTLRDLEVLGVMLGEGCFQSLALWCPNLKKMRVTSLPAGAEFAAFEGHGLEVLDVPALRLAGASSMTSLIRRLKSLRRLAVKMERMDDYLHEPIAVRSQSLQELFVVCKRVNISVVDCPNLQHFSAVGNPVFCPTKILLQGQCRSLHTASNDWCRSFMHVLDFPARPTEAGPRDVVLKGVPFERWPEMELRRIFSCSEGCARCLSAKNRGAGFLGLLDAA